MRHPLDPVPTRYAGRCPEALRRIRTYLSHRNPYLSHAVPALEGIAQVYVRLTANNRAEQGTVDWAVYGYRAAHRLHSAASDRAQAAATTLFDLTCRRGSAEAIRLGEPVLDHPTLAAARLAVARLLHTAGLCVPAGREAIAALYRCAAREGDPQGVDGAYLVEAVTMLHRCGRTATARALVTAYAELLPAADTEGREILIAHASQELGCFSEITDHQRVCGLRRDGGHPRRACTDLRERTLQLLKGL